MTASSKTVKVDSTSRRNLASVVAAVGHLLAPSSANLRANPIVAFPPR